MIHTEPRPLETGRRSRLRQAFVELNIATAVRERTDPGSPEHAAALKREREAAERVDALIEGAPPRS
jgi:hypothetical protein